MTAKVTEMPKELNKSMSLLLILFATNKVKTLEMSRAMPTKMVAMNSSMELWAVWKMFTVYCRMIPIPDMKPETTTYGISVT